MINFIQLIIVLFGDPIPEDIRLTTEDIRLTKSDEDV